MSKIGAIHIQFALPVTLTQEEDLAIQKIVQAAAKRSETKERVHWLAGTGSAHNADFTEWDDCVYVMECTSRVRYDSEPFEEIVQ